MASKIYDFSSISHKNCFPMIQLDSEFGGGVVFRHSHQFLLSSWSRLLLCQFHSPYHFHSFIFIRSIHINESLYSFHQFHLRFVKIIVELLCSLHISLRNGISFVLIVFLISFLNIFFPLFSSSSLVSWNDFCSAGMERERERTSKRDRDK